MRADLIQAVLSTKAQGRVYSRWLHPGLGTMHFFPWTLPTDFCWSSKWSIFAGWQHDLSILFYGLSEYVAIGSPSPWHKSMVNSLSWLGQVIYTQGQVETNFCSSPHRLLQRTFLKHIYFVWSQGKRWKPVTVFTRAVMGVLFKVQRNLVRVCRRSLSEEMQSPREWVLGVSLLRVPLYVGGGGGTHRHPLPTHACIQHGGWKLQAGRRWSAKWVDLCNRTVKVQRVSRRITSPYKKY